MNYTFDTLGRFDGVSATPTDRSTNVAPAEQTADYNWNGVEWVYAPNVLEHPTSGGATPAPVAAKLTRLQFRNRFTEPERVAIYTAAESVVAVRVYLDDILAAEEIDLTDAATIAGVNALEMAGLLAAGRAAEILEA